ncbi:hypothetical protein BX600DRAFT_391151 [Xylariales sp. PMI_506]|nr:hypothetical protein BX600DRAFT_391151 [Xylariales sp. PMI_506]
MPASQRKKLALPASLLQEIGASSTGAGRSTRRGEPSRKEQRKAQRVQKKQTHRTPNRRSETLGLSKSKPTAPGKLAAKSKSLPAKSREVDLDDEEDDEDDDGSSDEGELNMEDDDDIDLDEDDDLLLSKSDRRKLEKEDAEIAALEKKLGLKKGKKSKADDEDGLGDLLDDLGDDLLGEEDGEVATKRKRKAEADEWLAQKRRKALAASAQHSAFVESEDDLIEDDEGDDSDGLSNLGNSDYDEESEGLDDDGQVGSDDYYDEEDDDNDDMGHIDDGFDGFSDDDGEEPAPVRQKENPYVAPTTGVAKYVPPSLRKKAESSTDEVDAQVRKRVQGLINRLTNENMLGILKDFTGLYDNFARQIVTSSLIDLILALVCSPERRPDGFFTMIAGFVAAAQKALGVHISATMVQKLVEAFKEHHDRASGDQSDAGSKHLIALLAELYNMQVVGSKLVFDYVRLFLNELSELNTELLLRIIQMCGPSLRREDPHALKEIIARVKPADLKNVSVRTSFMIEEMKKLQSNKAKAAARNKDLAETRTQIRKRIGTLSGSREVQPLVLGLKEIENADKNGKWWVVGASWSGNREKEKQTTTLAGDEANEEADVADDDDLGIPDLWQLAKEQGFNTEVRQKIFVALHAGTDYENAELLLRKLRLNKHQRKELAEVIVRSGEAQAEFNPYYWLVASRFCGDRELAFQFRRCLTQRFRKMGEDIDTGDDGYDDVEDGEDYEPRRVVNLGKLYGNLVANRSLGLDILKYRNLAALQEKAQWFVEILLITVLQEASKEDLRKIFGSLDQDLARAVQYFLRKHVKKTDLLKNDEPAKKVVKKRVELVNRLLQAALTATDE